MFIQGSSRGCLAAGFVLALVLVETSAGQTPATSAGIELPSAFRGLCVTPEDFGAVGNDDKDDSDAFDKLAEALTGQVAVLIPARRYLLSRTWKLPYVQGGRVMGMGGLAHGELKLEHGLHGPAAELVWIGEEGGTMVLVQGTSLVWDSVALYGRGVAGTGLLMLKPTDRRGLGTGKHVFRGLSVNDCHEGLRLGNGGNNVDSCLFEYTYVEGCDVGVLLDANMAMGHYFSYLHLRRCPIGVWVRRGGDLVIRGGLNTSTGTFLKVGDEQPQVNPGRNNGMILVEGIKTDAQNKQMQWLEVVKADCALTFNNCHQAWTEDGNAYPRKWVLRGAVKLTIRDSVNLFGNRSFVLQSKGESAKPNVLLDRCRVDFGTGPEDWIESSSGHWRFEVRDCYRGSGEPLADVVR